MSKLTRRDYTGIATAASVSATLGGARALGANDRMRQAPANASLIRAAAFSDWRALALSEWRSTRAHHCRSHPRSLRGSRHAASSFYAFEKLVFGTDEAPENLDACVARHEAMLDACGVPEASRKKIYGETLAKILGIKVRA